MFITEVIVKAWLILIVQANSPVFFQLSLPYPQLINWTTCVEPIRCWKILKIMVESKQIDISQVQIY